MPTDLPIACSLSPAELPDRLAEIADLGRASLLSVQRSPTTAVLRFRRGSKTRGRLAAFVAAEARCCAFLETTVRESGDALALTISAPPGAALVLDEMVATFAESEPVARPHEPHE